jgi:hypothetical protein
MRVDVLTGIKTLIGENMVYSLFPPHVGMRQYWRDLDDRCARLSAN